MRKGKTMKKKNIIILGILALLLGTNYSHAQGIFIMEEEEEFSDRIGDAGLDIGEFNIPNAPNYDSFLDYTPIGNGMWLLGALGGVYLLGKRRKKKEE